VAVAWGQALVVPRVRVEQLVPVVALVPGEPQARVAEQVPVVPQALDESQGRVAEQVPAVLLVPDEPQAQVLRAKLPASWAAALGAPPVVEPVVPAPARTDEPVVPAPADLVCSPRDVGSESDSENVHSAGVDSVKPALRAGPADFGPRVSVVPLRMGALQAHGRKSESAELARPEPAAPGLPRQTVRDWMPRCARDLFEPRPEACAWHEALRVPPGLAAR